MILLPLILHLLLVKYLLAATTTFSLYQTENMPGWSESSTLVPCEVSQFEPACEIGTDYLNKLPKIIQYRITDVEWVEEMENAYVVTMEIELEYMLMTVSALGISGLRTPNNYLPSWKLTPYMLLNLRYFHFSARWIMTTEDIDGMILTTPFQININVITFKGSWLSSYKHGCPDLDGGSYDSPRYRIVKSCEEPEPEPELPTTIETITKIPNYEPDQRLLACQTEAFEPGCELDLGEHSQSKGYPALKKLEFIDIEWVEGREDWYIVTLEFEIQNSNAYKVENVILTGLRTPANYLSELDLSYLNYPYNFVVRWLMKVSKVGDFMQTTPFQIECDLLTNCVNNNCHIDRIYYRNGCPTQIDKEYDSPVIRFTKNCGGPDPEPSPISTLINLPKYSSTQSFIPCDPQTISSFCNFEIGESSSYSGYPPLKKFQLSEIAWVQGTTNSYIVTLDFEIEQFRHIIPQKLKIKNLATPDSYLSEIDLTGAELDPYRFLVRWVMEAESIGDFMVSTPFEVEYVWSVCSESGCEYEYVEYTHGCPDMIETRDMNLKDSPRVIFEKYREQPSPITTPTEASPTTIESSLAFSTKESVSSTTDEIRSFSSEEGLLPIEASTTTYTTNIEAIDNESTEVLPEPIDTPTYTTNVEAIANESTKTFTEPTDTPTSASITEAASRTTTPSIVIIVKGEETYEVEELELGQNEIMSFVDVPSVIIHSTVVPPTSSLFYTSTFEMPALIEFENIVNGGIIVVNTRHDINENMMAKRYETNGNLYESDTMTFLHSSKRDQEDRITLNTILQNTGDIIIAGSTDTVVKLQNKFFSEGYFGYQCKGSEPGSLFESLAIFENNGVIDLSNVHLVLEHSITGTGYILLRDKGALIIAGSDIDVAPSVQFFDDTSNLVIKNGATGSTFHFASFDIGNKILFEEFVSNHNYDEQSGILEVETSSQLFYFNIGHGYNAELFEVSSTDELYALSYRGLLPENANDVEPSISIRPVPQAPGIRPEIFTTTVTSVSGTSTTMVTIVIMVTTESSSWYTTTLYTLTKPSEVDVSTEVEETELAKSIVKTTERTEQETDETVTSLDWSPSSSNDSLVTEITPMDEESSSLKVPVTSDVENGESSITGLPSKSNSTAVGKTLTRTSKIITSITKVIKFSTELRENRTTKTKILEKTVLIPTYTQVFIVSDACTTLTINEMGSTLESNQGYGDNWKEDASGQSNFAEGNQKSGFASVSLVNEPGIIKNMPNVEVDSSGSCTRSAVVLLLSGFVLLCIFV